MRYAETHVARPHYENLTVWREAMRVVRRVYTLTSRFPDSEKSGLVAQMRRAAIGIPAKIAESAGSADPRRFLNALGQAQGAVRELQTYEALARQLRMSGWTGGWSVRRQLRRYSLTLAAESEALEQTLAEQDTAAAAAPRLRFRHAA